MLDTVALCTNQGVKKKFFTKKGNLNLSNVVDNSLSKTFMQEKKYLNRNIVKCFY